MVFFYKKNAVRFCSYEWKEKRNMFIISELVTEHKGLFHETKKVSKTKPQKHPENEICNPFLIYLRSGDTRPRWDSTDLFKFIITALSQLWVFFTAAIATVDTILTFLFLSLHWDPAPLSPAPYQSHIDPAHHQNTLRPLDQSLFPQR